MTKAIFFDFDGVLADDELIHFALVRDLAKEHGINVTREQYFKELIGFDDRDCFKHIFKQESHEQNAFTIYLRVYLYPLFCA